MTKKLKNAINTDELINSIYDTINNEDTNAYFLSADDNAPTNIIDWVPTGNPILDLVISNRKHAGLPVGRLSEVSGLPSSGKSLLIGHILAETQKKGGIGVLFDTEQSADKGFLKAIGVDLDKLIYVDEQLIETIFETIEKIIETIRSSNNDRLVTIVVDSIMGATNKIEYDGDYDKSGYATQKAIILSQAMRKINGIIGKNRIALVVTNQLRTKLNIGFGDPYEVSGGKAIPFHSSLRLRLQMIGQIKDKNKNTIGVKTKCKVAKSRIGPPFRTCEFEIYFDRGIDSNKTWFDAAKLSGAIVDAKKIETTKDKEKTRKIKGYYALKEDPFGIRFRGTEFSEKILTDKKLKEKIYDDIAEYYILKYVDPNNIIPIDEEKIEYFDVDE